jgi:hypothetical protein
MNELGALLPILPYALSVALLAALLHRLAKWSDGPSLAGLVGGHWDLPWPRGVQEEEPVRWNIERLRVGGERQGQVPGSTLSAGASASPSARRPTSSVRTPHGNPCDAPAPYPPASAAAC